MKKIAIVSLLKPIDDPRHYHKIAVSLAKPNKYAINIIANDPKKKLPTNDILIYSTDGKYSISKFSLDYYLFVMRKLRTIQPDVVIINHPLLLIPVGILKLSKRFKLIYDLQENYKLNLLHQKLYSTWKALMFAQSIRLLERIFAPMVNHFLLAEAIYEKQLPFIGKKFTILENKSLKWPSTKNQLAQAQSFLFSGNISKISGIFRAISCFEKLQAQDHNLKLTIVGHCPDLKLLKALETRNSKNPGIELQVSSNPIKYELIQEAMLIADIGFICYQDNPSNAGKLPTKYFEYNALGLPYIVFKSSSWAKLPSPLALIIDEQNPDINELRHAISKIGFDYSKSSFEWQSEEQKLLKLLDQLS